MKKQLIIYLCSILLFAMPVFAQQSAHQKKFKLLISQSRNYEQINTLIETLLEDPSIQEIVPINIKQRHLMYYGYYVASSHDVSQIIRGISQDQFDMHEEILSNGMPYFTLISKPLSSQRMPKK